MRKIVAGEVVSLDGVMESPGQWPFPYWSDEMGAVVGEQMANADAMLLGRVTFQALAASWPDKTEEDMPAAGHMNDTQKYVVSSTRDDVSAWPNSTLISGDVVAEIATLREQPGGDIGVTGSATLVQSLLREGLLDELHLLVHPITLGTGKRILDAKAGKVPLALVESQIVPNGVMCLVYAPDRGAGESGGPRRRRERHCGPMPPQPRHPSAEGSPGEAGVREGMFRMWNARTAKSALRRVLRMRPG